MSRKKPVDSPGPISLRRSPRLLSRNSLPESSKQERNLDRNPGKGHGSCLDQTRRKELIGTCGEVEPGASIKSKVCSVGLVDLVNSVSFSEDYGRIGGFVDGSCIVRRSPRFSDERNSSFTPRPPLRVLNGGKSYGKTKHVTVFSSQKSLEGNVTCCGKQSSKLGLSVWKNKKASSEGGKCELDAPPRGRQRKRRSIIVADDKVGEGGISSELKRAKNRISTACVNKSQDDNTVGSNRRNAEIIGRRITRSMSVGSIRECSYKENDSMGKNPEIASGLCTERRLKRDDTAASPSGPLEGKGERKEGKVRGLNKGKEEERFKTNIKLNDNGDSDATHRWTKDQEMALQRAYFTANPSPHFWKKVSKLVPGKSAQECFDKVHSDQITPRQLRPRSRAKKANLSPIQQFSLSASKLLKPTEPKTKRLNKRGQLAQKTIRRLLEKKCLVEQGDETDLFSVLEPSTGQKTLSTPILKEGIFRSSRFVNASGGSIVSPPVLKQVKNKALHEKYIDRLHCRDAKRKVESAKLQGKNVVKPGDVQKKDLSRAAKDALVFDVKDAIDKLKSLRADSSNRSSDFSCDSCGSENEDSEIDL